MAASRSDIEDAEEMAQSHDRSEEGLFDMVGMRQCSLRRYYHFINETRCRLCACALLSQDEDMPTADAPTALVTAHPVAERLDSLMVVLMAYVKDVSHLNGSLRTQL